MEAASQEHLTRWNGMTHRTEALDLLASVDIFSPSNMN